MVLWYKLKLIVDAYWWQHGQVIRELAGLENRRSQVQIPV